MAAAVLALLHTQLLVPAQPSALPSLLPVLALHQPFASLPPDDPQQQQTQQRFLRALDALVVGKDEAGRLVGWTVAKEVLDQEARAGERVREGGVVERYGRAWVGTLAGLAGQKKLPESLLAPYAAVLQTLYLTSPLHPQFQREVVLPSLQKLVLALLSFFPPSAPLSPPHVDAVLPVLGPLVALHPASLRPLQAQLQTLALRALTSPSASSPTKRAAADLYAALPSVVGKSAAPQALHAAVLAALESAHQGADALFEGVFEELPRERDGEGVKYAQWEEERREKDMLQRKAAGRGRVEGGVRLVAGLLRTSTERAVPVPIGSILALALRLFRVTSATPIAVNASPELANLTLAVLPELHALACALVGQLALSVGPSMMPHTTEIASHLIYLLEQNPSPPTQSTLLSTASLLFTHAGPLAAARDVSGALLDRAVKACLRVVGGALLPVRAAAAAASPAAEGAGGAKGKGKKRSHEESSATGGSILASAALPLGTGARAALHAALDLLALLLPHPALAPPTHALATKVLLSGAYALPHSFALRGADGAAVERRLEALLVRGIGEGPVAREGGVGPELGWVVNALGSGSTLSSEVSKFLNPLLPPTHQPLPALEAQLLLAAPGPSESGTRIELGLVNASDSVRVVAEGEGMEVDVPAKEAHAQGKEGEEVKHAESIFPVAPSSTSTAVADAPPADPFALPALPVPPPAAPVAAPPVAPPAPVQPAPAPALQPLPTAAKGVEVGAPLPGAPAREPAAPVVGGWQGVPGDGGEGGEDEEDEDSDGEMPEIDMGDDTEEEDDE